MSAVIVIVNPNKSVNCLSIKLKYLRVKDAIFCFFDFAFTPKTHVKNQHKNWKYGDSCVIILCCGSISSSFNILINVSGGAPVGGAPVGGAPVGGTVVILHVSNAFINIVINLLKVLPVDAVACFSYKSYNPDTSLLGRVLDIVL